MFLVEIRLRGPGGRILVDLSEECGRDERNYNEHGKSMARMERTVYDLIFGTGLPLALNVIDFPTRSMFVILYCHFFVFFSRKDCVVYWSKERTILCAAILLFVYRQ